MTSTLNHALRTRAIQSARRLVWATMGALAALVPPLSAQAADPVSVTLTTVGCVEREQTSRLILGRIYLGREDAVEMQAKAMASGNCILISQGTRVRLVELNASQGLVCAQPLNRPHSGCYWINDTLIISPERVGWR